QELYSLYEKEQDKDLRMQIVSAFASMQALDQLNQVIRTEKDPDVRRRAVRALGNLKSDKTGTALVEMYGRETDRDTKKAVITGHGNQNNVDGLSATARKENEKELVNSIVQKIVEMGPRSKAAQDFLMEIIKK